MSDKPIHLVGTSMGGALVALYAATYPDCVEKLTLICPASKLSEVWLTIIFPRQNVIIPPEQRSCWGVYWFHSVRPSVRPSRLPCPLCNIYSSGWILSILATNDHYHERVCRTQWPLTLTYIFKVIWPWLWKSCPLCNVFSSRSIISMFATNNHYH